MLAKASSCIDLINRNDSRKIKSASISVFSARLADESGYLAETKGKNKNKKGQMRRGTNESALIHLTIFARDKDK
jgi:hypothetical protein